MGNDPQDGSGPEYFSTQGRAMAPREAPKETGGVLVGNTPNWRRKWWKQASRGSGNMSRGGRIRSRSILERNRFWTSVSVPLGGQGRGCIGGGGNMTVYIWRGAKKRAAA